MHGGRTAFEDTERAIGDIAASLAESSSILPRFFGGSGIERIAFVATEADHVPELHRDNLRALMREIVRLAREHGPDVVITTPPPQSFRQQMGGPASLTVIASRWCGAEAGRSRSSGPIASGNVPIAHPPDSFGPAVISSCPFTPPPIDPNAANGIPHLGLDRILVDLIEQVMNAFGQVCRRSGSSRPPPARTETIERKLDPGFIDTTSAPPEVVPAVVLVVRQRSALVLSVGLASAWAFWSWVARYCR